MSRELRGACFCNTVQYTVEDSFEYAMICHCSQCRRTTGSAFKPFAGIKRGKLRLTAGDAALLVHGDAEGNDTHCGACGSLLYSVVREGKYLHVAMGSLIDAPSIRPTAHIFVGSKAPWFEITDALPQYDELP
ncbi:GFA family protein [Dongia sp.]|uniref:GFA family protein n=1 Tax=Dongia sp. TaxID=1977262 RepID=UPI0037519DA2